MSPLVSQFCARQAKSRGSQLWRGQPSFVSMIAYKRYLIEVQHLHYRLISDESWKFLIHRISDHLQVFKIELGATFIVHNCCYTLTIIFNYKMEDHQESERRSRSLKDTIYHAITAHKVKSVATLLRNTHKRINQHHEQLEYSKNSVIHSQLESPIIHTHISHQCYTPSPPSFAHTKSASYRSPQNKNSKKCAKNKKSLKVINISKNVSKEKYLFSNQIKSKNAKPSKTGKILSFSRGTELLNRSQERSLGIESKSRERGSSHINLASIVEQQSSESNMRTPSQKKSKSRKSHKGKPSGSQTHKKEKQGIKEVVWHRLERCLKEPEKFHRLFKNELLTIRLRIIRKKIIQIQVCVDKQLSSLNVFLDRGNLECQNIQERFQRVRASTMFSLYSSVRAIDINHLFHLPKIQIEVVAGEEQKLQKMITLPYCWLHFAEEPSSHQSSKSRIKTKVCMQEMSCSRSRVKMLSGVLYDWEGRSLSKGQMLWYSRLMVGGEQFEISLSEKEGVYRGEVSGRGEQRLTCMMQFLCGLWS